MKVFIDANLLIYLNTIINPQIRGVYEEFYIDLLSRYRAYTDPLVLDELIYISKAKYKVPYTLSINFIETIVKPYVEILGIGEDEYDTAKDTILQYGLKPSDALHVAVMVNNNISYIASEDGDFDKVDGIKRLWLKSIA